MRQREKWVGPDAEYIVPLYRLLISNVPMERVADWMAINGMRHSNQMVKRTLKIAGREDLIEYLIKEEDINIGDSIKSRMTAREGKVVGIRPDGDTIEVKWDTGGRQLLSKESVFKLRTKEIVDHDDIRKVCTEKDETYKNMEDRKLYQRKE
jgi:hypothetical protein